MDGFHLALYDVATGAAVTAQDLTAVPDPVISQRNSHFTLTDPLALLAVQVGAAALTKASIRSPTWLAQTIFNVDPLMLSETQQSPPRIMDLRDLKPVLPQQEEIQIQVADTQAAGEVITAALWIGTPGWNQNVPRGIGPISIFPARVTATVALTARAWSPLTALAFEQGLRAGVYAVVGMRWFVANALYHRMLFPRSTMYAGRSFRPGDMIVNGLGDISWTLGRDKLWPWGVWGKFQTSEPPQVEFWSSATVGSATYQGIMMLVKLSDNTDPGLLGS